MKIYSNRIVLSTAVLAATLLCAGLAKAEEKFLPPAPIGDINAATANATKPPIVPPAVGVAIKPPTIVEPSIKNLPPIMPQVKTVVPPQPELPKPELPKVDSVHVPKPKLDGEIPVKPKAKAVKEPPHPTSNPEKNSDSDNAE